ncbi:hypothetical protein [Clostridium sp. ZBS18]|uniref:hypothetical protein n=1 Tax=Clostridium sp. ZBS18 TaxID=2949967 RepID=UPI00207A9615|nr:hypothetical protein [Clostridium sp. ZBS18]
MNNVELKVNVINQLKLFKQSTFKDRLCFLDEDIQNAQRAKATEIRVTNNQYDGGSLIIENNGKILDNPQSLFSIAESGWDNDVMETENPFGMGFFSNITVSDKIEIYSGNKYILFDVNKMIKNNDPNLEVQETNDYYDGFKLILNNFDFKNIYGFEIEKRLERLGKYIHELDIYYDGILQEKKDLLEMDNEYTFSTTLDDENIKGWIAISSNYTFGSSEIAIFYKGRFVSKLENFPYLRGDIHINDKVLNLTSPDRKDIIKDSKFKDFQKSIKLYIEELAKDSFMYGEDKEIEKYSNAINYYINKKDLVKNTKFSVFKGKEKIEYLKGIAKAKSKNKDIETFKDYNLYLDKEKSSQNESLVDEVIVEEKMVNLIPDAKGIVYYEGGSSYSSGKVEKPEINENELKEKDGELILSDEIVFWIGFNELEQFESKFNIINHYNIKLIVARNKIEEEMLKGLKDEYNTYHISELVESVSFKSTISNTDLKIKERRALMIFEMISRMFGKTHNIFSIGDVMTIKTIEVERAKIKTDIIDEDIVIIKDSLSDKVYVDRSIINLSQMDESLDETLTLKDVQFILMNLDDICDSIQFIVKETEDKIRNKLLKTIAYME